MPVLLVTFTSLWEMMDKIGLGRSLFGSHCPTRGKGKRAARWHCSQQEERDVVAPHIHLYLDTDRTRSMARLWPSRAAPRGQRIFVPKVPTLSSTTALESKGSNTWACWGHLQVSSISYGFGAIESLQKGREDWEQEWFTAIVLGPPMCRTPMGLTKQNRSGWK